MSLYTNSDQCKHKVVKYSQYTTRRCTECGLVSKMEWSHWRNPIKEDLENMPLDTD